ncbi:kinase-like domain-containing protein [Mycena olivaceomarginata]|nr:kinase-like domain-containing protein [Mycena olivaceomarginata]
MPQSGSMSPANQAWYPSTNRESSDMERPPNDTNRIEEQQATGRKMEDQQTETERWPDEFGGPSSLTGTKSKSGLITYHNLLTFISSIPESRTNHGTVLNGYHRSMSAEDSMSAIINSRYWRRTLLKLIADLHISEDAALRNALCEDEEQLAKNIVAILYSDSEQKAVLNLKGNSAQISLMFFKTLRLLLQKEHNSKARRTIVKLSQACDKLPSTLFISGVTRPDEHPSFGGGFGDIYQAVYQEKRVALKHMRTFYRGAEQRHMRLQFCREALVWQRLQHPFILPFIGIDHETFPGSLCMVSPWMENGTVLKYLKDHGKANVDRLLLETAQGLHYLHSHNIVHGDLRGANILITHEWRACLADFGLVSFSDATPATHTSHHRAGSLRWMAPELISPERFDCCFVATPATDVYAFGCVCLELYTGRPPFSSLPEPAVLLKVIEGGRPE